MVWGCMGWSGVGELAEVEGRMDADQYVDILDNHLLPSMEESGIVEGGCIFISLFHSMQIVCENTNL